MTDEEALTQVLEAAIGSVDGMRQLERAAEFISAQFSVGRFNTERAVEVYKTAIDSVIWTMIKDSPARSAMYHYYLRSGIGRTYALRLSEKFKQETGAYDQRRPRKFLRSIFGA